MLLTKLQQQTGAYLAHQTLLKIAPNSVMVGGAVRDLLLDRVLHDLDYVLAGNALFTARRLANALGGAFFPLDERRDIGRIVWQTSTGDRLIIDVAALRGNNLDEDLQARDFTINAITLGADGYLYDPLHGGQDIQTASLRLCSPDSLLRDPVRILRAVRFIHQFGLRPDAELVALVGSASLGLDMISPERQRDELLKILALPEPQDALNTFRAWNLEERFFPELADLRGIEQPSPHVYNAHRHSLVTLRWMSCIDALHRLDFTPAGDLESAIFHELAPYRRKLQAYLNHLLVPDRPRWLWLRFAALAHDWGKAATASLAEDGRVRFWGHEAISAELAGHWLERKHCASSEISFVSLVCKGHMRPIFLSQGERPPTRRSRYRFYRDLGNAAPGVVLLHLADYLATYGLSIEPDDLKRHLQFVSLMLEPILETDSQQYLAPKPLLSGSDLIELFGLASGPRIGELLEALCEAQAVGEVTDQDHAVVWIRERLV